MYNGNVLVVDDERWYIEALIDYLATQGMSVASIPEGEASVSRMLEIAKNPSREIAAVVLDDMMPIGNNLLERGNLSLDTIPNHSLKVLKSMPDLVAGLIGVRELRKAGLAIPIICLTLYDSAEYAEYSEELRRLGVFVFDKGHVTQTEIYLALHHTLHHASDSGGLGELSESDIVEIGHKLICLGGVKEAVDAEISSQDPEAIVLALLKQQAIDFGATLIACVKFSEEDGWVTGSALTYRRKPNFTSDPLMPFVDLSALKPKDRFQIDPRAAEMTELDPWFLNYTGDTLVALEVIDEDGAVRVRFGYIPHGASDVQQYSPTGDQLWLSSADPILRIIRSKVRTFIRVK